MNKKLVKLLTHDLIEACGGLEAASHALRAGPDPVHLSVGQLSRCQNPNAPDTLNIWAVIRLERLCGKPIITAPGSKACEEPDVADVFEEALDVVQAAGEVLEVARRAKSDGHKSPSEAREIDAALNKLEEQLREARAANAA